VKEKHGVVGSPRAERSVSNLPSWGCPLSQNEGPRTGGCGVISVACTVFFEDPFWVGVWERTDGKTYCAAKTTFGMQPSDAQVWAFVLGRYGELAFSKPERSGGRRPVEQAKNPKRLQREAARAVCGTGVGTKAQQALKSQYGAGKEAQKERSRVERLAEEEQRFLLRQQKKKALRQ